MSRLSQAIEVGFTVEGRGEFPVDMLRYDECCPATPAEAARMQYPTDMHGEKLRLLDTVRQVRLTSTNIHKPTIARWASFGWTVTAIDV